MAISKISEKGCWSIGSLARLFLSWARLRQSRMWPSEINSIVKSFQKTTTNVGGKNCLRFANSRRGDDELCEHGSDRRETSAKRVSDDLQFSIFWRRKFFFEKVFRSKFVFRIFFSVFRYFRQILEDLGIFGRQNQLPGGILLQMVKFSGP